MRNSKILLSLLTITLSSLTSLGQDWSNVMHEELIESLIDPSDSIYIADRNQLEKVTGYDCTDNMLTFIFTSKTKDKIEIAIEKGVFSRSQHILELADTVYKHIHGQKRVDYLKVKNIIDGRYSYGIDATIPKSEIKSMSVIWNRKSLAIPDTAFSTFYESHLCGKLILVEAYLSKDNKNLFIYISGSDGAGSYSVKFVFDKVTYITRIVGTNEMTDGFDFLDGTAKVND
ncbi:MAG: hypothetical protein JKY52_04605 [Flavobacteriales bacterium]|nr:hypothetical protein [Flavobacteriales bacterium]